MDLQTIVNERVKELQYSTVNKTNLNNSTVQWQQVLVNLSDLINPAYRRWYKNKLQELGLTRFMKFANYARASSDTPKILFRWMLTNPDEVVLPENDAKL